MECISIHIFDNNHWNYDHRVYKTAYHFLAGNRVDGSGRLADAGGETGDDHVDNYREESCEKGGERVVHTTVLLNLNNLVDCPANEIHPRERGGERKAGNDGVKGLSLELARDGDKGFLSKIDRHFVLYNI